MSDDDSYARTLRGDAGWLRRGIANRRLNDDADDIDAIARTMEHAADEIERLRALLDTAAAEAMAYRACLILMQMSDSASPGIRESVQSALDLGDRIQSRARS